MQAQYGSPVATPDDRTVTRCAVSRRNHREDADVMEFSYDMFIDLGTKSAFLIGYGVLVIVSWMVLEKVFGAFRNTR
jgi:hypothetical protein